MPFPVLIAAAYIPWGAALCLLFTTRPAARRGPRTFLRRCTLALALFTTTYTAAAAVYATAHDTFGLIFNLTIAAGLTTLTLLAYARSRRCTEPAPAARPHLDKDNVR